MNAIGAVTFMRQFPKVFDILTPINDIDSVLYIFIPLTFGSKNGFWYVSFFQSIITSSKEKHSNASNNSDRYDMFHMFILSTIEYMTPENMLHIPAIHQTQCKVYMGFP